MSSLRINLKNKIIISLVLITLFSASNLVNAFNGDYSPNNPIQNEDAFQDNINKVTIQPEKNNDANGPRNLERSSFIETNTLSSQGYINPWTLEEVSQNNLTNKEPSLVVEGEDEEIVHAFWHAIPAGGTRENIFYCKKIGTTWEEPSQLIKNQTTSDKSPKATIDSNGTIHLVWHRHWIGVDGQIWYTNSLNWSQRILIRKPTSNDRADNPDIIVDDYGRIHVTWDELSYGDFQVFYASNKNNWQPEILPYPSAFAKGPIIKWCAADNTTRIAYTRDQEGFYPEVCWIYEDATIEIYHPSIAVINTYMTIGYDERNGKDYLFWLQEGNNLTIATNNIDNPEIWSLLDAPERTAVANIGHLKLYCLAGNTIFISWKYYHLNLAIEVYAFSAHKNDIWRNYESIFGEEGYNYKKYNGFKDANGNIRIVFERVLKGNTSASEIFYLFLGIDDRPPTVNFIYPKPYDILSGIVNVSVEANDAAGILQVKFYETIDGATSLRYTDYDAPYVWSWDTSISAILSRKIKAEAIDNNGEVNTTEIRVNVDNTPPIFTNVLKKEPVPVYDNSTVTLSCNIQENDQITNASLYYRFKGDSTWNKTTLEPFFGREYTTEINMTVGGKTVEYYVEAEDRAGNIGNSTIEEFEVLWYDLGDFDGLGDNIEEKYGCDPHNPDTDGDGLEDGDEVYIFLTDPSAKDTDGDGYSDGEEITKGSDPLDPNSTPPGWFALHSRSLIIMASIIGGILIIAAVIYLLMETRVIKAEKVQEKASNARSNWRAFWAQIWRGAKRTFGKETKEKQVEPKTVKEPKKPLTELDMQALERKFDDYIQQIEVLTFDFLERKLNLSEGDLEDFLLEMKRKDKPIRIDLESKNVKVIGKTEENQPNND
ncbi:MAG: hypothetical protein GF308_12950 [Candidatus Heimdallarchaeota archaeon]|nr:hypothetical protein [Candidatus Heimdallarchaeota archaeon]